MRVCQRSVFMMSSVGALVVAGVLAQSLPASAEALGIEQYFNGTSAPVASTSAPLSSADSPDHIRTGSVVAGSSSQGRVQTVRSQPRVARLGTGSLARAIPADQWFYGAARDELFIPSNDRTHGMYRVGQDYKLPKQFQKQVVSFETKEKPGTIIVNTTERHLYLVMDGGKALRYGVGVGKEGFEWKGVNRITRKAEWPDWRPPAEMLERRPDLPVFMEGGPENPLGARAMYLGDTLYRIHGSNEPWTIGQAVSSGCIRMTNEDVTDLYSHAQVGAKVIVM